VKKNIGTPQNVFAQLSVGDTGAPTKDTKSDHALPLHKYKRYSAPGERQAAAS